MRHSSFLGALVAVVVGIAVAHIALKLYQVEEENVAMLSAYVSGQPVLSERALRRDENIRSQGGFNPKDLLNYQLVERLNRDIADDYSKHIAGLTPSGLAPDDPAYTAPALATGVRGPVGPTWFDRGRLLMRTLDRKLDDPSLYVLLTLAFACWIVGRAAALASPADGCTGPNSPRGHRIGFVAGVLGLATMTVYTLAVFLSHETFFYANRDIAALDRNAAIRLVQQIEGATVLVAIAIGYYFFAVGVATVERIRTAVRTESGAGLDQLARAAGLLYSCWLAPIIASILILYPLALVLLGAINPSLWGASSPRVKIPALIMYTLPFLALWGYAYARLRVCFKPILINQNASKSRALRALKRMKKTTSSVFSSAPWLLPVAAILGVMIQTMFSAYIWISFFYAVALLIFLPTIIFTSQLRSRCCRNAATGCVL